MQYILKKIYLFYLKKVSSKSSRIWRCCERIQWWKSKIEANVLTFKKSIFPNSDMQNIWIRRRKEKYNSRKRWWTPIKK